MIPAVLLDVFIDVIVAVLSNIFYTFELFKLVVCLTVSRYSLGSPLALCM